MCRPTDYSVLDNKYPKFNLFFWFANNTGIGCSSDARLFCKNKQANLKNKLKMGNSTEKQAQRVFGRKIKKNIKPTG